MDGRPQRKYYAPEDIHSPTVSTEGLFLSLGIDAKEERHVVTCDVEGAYLHASMEDVVIMMFEGDTMVDYMVASDPKNMDLTFMWQRMEIRYCMCNY